MNVLFETIFSGNDFRLLKINIAEAPLSWPLRLFQLRLKPRLVAFTSSPV
jgi:hypothetical protein